MDSFLLSFHDETRRFRLCTSYVQAVINETILRTKMGQVNVIHEPGTKEFQYGSLAIREFSLQGSRDDKAWSASGGFFKAPKANNAGLLSEDAPEVVVDRMKVHDEKVNTLVDIVDDISTMVNAISQETEREVEQLKSINSVANKSLEKANKNAFRAAKQT